MLNPELISYISSPPEGTEIKISFHESDTPENANKDYGSNVLLNEQRNKIDKINPNVWKKIRWYINDYDFIVRDPIINRAFFKYWEIIHQFDIYPENERIFHCCEAPGGFIQGSNILLNLKKEKRINSITTEDGFTKIVKNKKNDLIYSISLNPSVHKYKSFNLPTYNKNVLNNNVCITYGKDNTGDVNNLENIEYIKNLLGNSVFLTTADGGFDEGSDFNHKEQLHFELILNEILLNISIQKKGGHFILKMFDIFCDTSIHLLYLLNNIYKNVYIYKPKTSRPTNSEKYIVCKEFIGYNDYIGNVIQNLSLLNNQYKKSTLQFNYFKLFENIPKEFTEKIFEMNKKLLNRQCEFLGTAIDLCKKHVDKEIDIDKAIDDNYVYRQEKYNEWKRVFKLFLQE